MPMTQSQKYTLNGTSTKTPFHLKSTFTPTKDPPPTFTPTETSSPSPTFTSSPTVTETPQITDTDTPPPATDTPTPTNVPASPTPKKESQQGSDKPTVKVSYTTNCRTGPGIEYSKLTPLQAGKSTSLVGRDKSYTYWII